MFTRSKLRFSIKTEDENAKNQRILEEKINLKKQLIRNEFETFQKEQTLSLFFDNQSNFKKELDYFKSLNQAKTKKLFSIMSLTNESRQPSSSFLHETTLTQSNQINDDYSKDKLKEKFDFYLDKIAKVENSYDEQVLNQTSLKAKIEEFVKNINIAKKNSRELKYLCNLSDNRFKYLQNIKFNSHLKEV